MLVSAEVLNIMVFADKENFSIFGMPIDFNEKQTVSLF